MIKITLTNNFHNTSTTLNMHNLADKLTHSQISRARYALCSANDCLCGEDMLNTRGSAWRVRRNVEGELYLFNSEGDR